MKTKGIKKVNVITLGCSKNLVDSESLMRQLELINGSKAIVIALDPRTGGVLSLVSLPSFDNNAFANSRYSNYDYRNR